MAKTITFQVLTNGRCMLNVAEGATNISIPLGADDFVVANHTDDKFTVFAKHLMNMLTGTDGSFTFGISELDKSNCTPVLSGTTTEALIVEITNNYFPCPTGVATGNVGANAIAYSTSIPFSRNYSTMSHTVTGAIAFTPDATSRITGGTTYVRLIADGSHTPTYNALFGTAIGSYTTAVGSINLLAFTWNGSEYSVTISLLGTVPVVSSISATDLHTIPVVFNKAISGTIAGYSAKQNGTSRLPSSVSGTTTRSLVFAATFLNTDTLLLSYDSTTGDSVDAQGHALTSFTDSAVTNSI